MSLSSMNMLRASSLAVSVGLLLSVMASGAFAQQKKQPPAAAPAASSPTGAQTFLLGTFGDWKALMSGKDKGKICYALAQPKERKPATLKRDPAYFFISNRASDGAKNEIAFKLGFAAKDGTVTVGAANFALLVNGESAFLKNPAQEAQLIEAMKKASDLTIKAPSLRGNETTDKYSLNGFGKALERMTKECP